MKSNLERYMAAAIAAGPPWVWSTGMTDWGRDPELWPGFLQQIKPTARIWCAGTATGEEIVTLAARTPSSVTIHATDIRPDALARCQTGRYPAEMVMVALDRGDLTAGDVSRMFEPAEPGAQWWETTEEIRSRVTWQLHDLMTDPLPTADIVFCRNVLHMIPTDQRAGVVESLGSLDVPIVIGKSDAVHMNRYWSAKFDVPVSLVLDAAREDR